MQELYVLFTSLPGLDLSGFPKPEELQQNALEKVKAFAAKHFVYGDPNKRPEPFKKMRMTRNTQPAE